MREAKPPGRWQPGTSGNPRGRPPGTGAVAKLRAAIAEHVPEIVERLVSLAREGDVQAARLLLERVIAPVRPTEQPTTLDLPSDNLAAQGRAVLAAAANGELAPSQAAALISALGALARVVEVDELTRRIETLEALNGRA